MLKNIDLLEHVGGLIGQFGEPFLMGAGWYVEPEVLLAPRWVYQVGGVLLASNIPTRGPSEYDYFVVSSTLAHRAEAPQVVADAPVGTHCFVGLRPQDFWAAPMAWVEDPRRAFCFPKTKEAILKMQVPVEALDDELAVLSEPLRDFAAARSRWFSLAKQHLAQKPEVESGSLRHHLGRCKGIRLTLKPLSELRRAKRRKLDAASTEALAGSLR